MFCKRRYAATFSLSDHKLLSWMLTRVLFSTVLSMSSQSVPRAYWRILPQVEFQIMFSNQIQYNHFLCLEKKMQLLVAPRISVWFGLPWSALAASGLAKQCGMQDAGCRGMQGGAGDASSCTHLHPLVSLCTPLHPSFLFVCLFVCCLSTTCNTWSALVCLGLNIDLPWSAGLFQITIERLKCSKAISGWDRRMGWKYLKASILRAVLIISRSKKRRSTWQRYPASSSRKDDRDLR